MLVIPRLEVLGGRCARTGDARSSKSDDALNVARWWTTEGFSRLQFVDRDAQAGRRPNLSLLEDVARDMGVEVDISAASESAEQIESCLDAGAGRVILGPRAVAEFDWLASAANTFPGALIVETSINARRAVMRGWVRSLPIDLLDLVEELAGVPLGGLFITSREGARADGLELALLEDVVEACGFPVLVEDTQPTDARLRAFENRGLAGVVIPGDALATVLDARSVANEFGR